MHPPLNIFNLVLIPKNLHNLSTIISGILHSKIHRFLHIEPIKICLVHFYSNSLDFKFTGFNLCNIWFLAVMIFIIQ